MLKIDLQIQEPYLLEAFQELLPQAGISLKETDTVQEGNCLLFTPPYEADDRPSLNFLGLSRPLHFLDLLFLLEGLPYGQGIIFAHFSLDLREKVLKNLNTQENQRLTEKECQLLCFFHRHRGEDVPKETLLQEIWGYHPDAETHTLETHIYRLRQKLEENSNDPQIILNGKKGYFLSNA